MKRPQNSGSTHSNQQFHKRPRRAKRPSPAPLVGCEEEPPVIILDDDSDSGNEVIAVKSIPSPLREMKINSDYDRHHNELRRRIFDGCEYFHEYCAKHAIPVDYEERLIGVTFCASRELEEKVRQYGGRHYAAMQTLDAAIWNHYEENGQKDDVYRWKLSFIQRLSQVLSGVLQTPFEIKAVGSSVNGCGSYNSDLDICLLIPNDQNNGTYNFERNYATKKLNTIIRFLRSRRLQNEIGSVQLIRAKVPIIKMTGKGVFNKLEVDLNVNNVAGIYNSHLLHYYSRVDLRFPAMCLLIKHWAITNGINDPLNGSFNSYSLIMLVLHYLQSGVQPAILPNLQYLCPAQFDEKRPLHELALFQTIHDLPCRVINTTPISELLAGFFLYYSEFDFENHGISIRNGGLIPRPSSAHFIFIEEPFDLLNVARSVTADGWNHIRSVIRHGAHVFSRQTPKLSSIRVSVHEKFKC